VDSAQLEGFEELRTILALAAFDFLPKINERSAVGRDVGFDGVLRACLPSPEMPCLCMLTR
jgi:hypothetical protein